MKNIFRAYLLVVATIFGSLQLLALPNKEFPKDIFARLMQVGSKSSAANLSTSPRYESLITDLQEKQVRWKGNDQKLLGHMFYKVHRQFLKTYKQYQSFEQLMDKGMYNCLTGTALYALILEELDYEYDIIETTYHTFIMVHANGQRYLIESTDPANGFEYDEQIITERLAAVQQREQQRDNDDTYDYEVNVFKKIDLTQLIGLQYYNMAVAAYNSQNYLNAAVLLDQASSHYNSERFREFLVLIVSKISEDASLQQKFIKDYRQLNILAVL